MSQRQAAMRYADREFSLFVRESEGRCVTCHQSGALECSHFFGRRKLSTRWNLRNCHAQCHDCHLGYHRGQKYYKAILVNLYGKDGLEDLERLSNTVVKLSVSEIKDIGNKYKTMRKALNDNR